MKAAAALGLALPKRTCCLTGLALALAFDPGALVGCSRLGPGGVTKIHQASGRGECSALPPLVQKRRYRVGFVPIYEPKNPWGVTNTNAMIGEAERRGYELIYSPFTANAAEQVAQMRELTAAQVDAIILRPIDATALGPSVTMARKACIPVFTENRFVDRNEAVPGVDYVTGIGADPLLQGQMVADWLVRATGGKATIIEIEGSRGSSSAIGRKQGFDAAIAAQQGMKIIASEAADFDRVKGHDVAKRLLTQYPSANVIFAHADVMALGVLSAVRELNRVPGKDVTIVSIDGLQEAVQAVMDGTIAALAFNDPKLAAISFDTMEQYAAGRAIAPRISVNGYMIDRANAAQMLLETF